MTLYVSSSVRAAGRSAWLMIAMFAMLMVAPVAVSAATDVSAPAGKAFTICENQTYALCATARCRVYNGVSYCKCDVEHGDSISLSFDYRKSDVCEINAAGKTNGYMVSTYSLPPSVKKKGGDQALYTCPAETSTGSYGQCDGGMCFKSTRGQEFPGLGKVAKGEIVCSCPITTADPSTAKTGYQIVGPYPCQKSFFKYCSGKVANTDTGSTIYVGAPTGSPRFLTKQLYGKVPPLNHCE
jgi:hypothetical protein